MRLINVKSNQIIGLDDGRLIVGDMGLHGDKRFAWSQLPDDLPPTSGNSNPSNPWQVPKMVLGLTNGYVTL